MSPVVKVVVILGACVAIAGAAVVLLGGAWLDRNKGRWIAEGQAATRDGAALGARSEDVACVDGALEWLDACGSSDLDLRCTTMARLFLDGCLGAARPTDALCDGVPSRDAVLDSAAWATRACAARDRGESQSCTRVLGSLQVACAAR